jgi:hypothetical protein
VITFRAQIHDHLRVAFAPHFVHGHVARRTHQLHLLIGRVGDAVELEEDIFVLRFDFFQVLCTDERSFAGFANVHLFEDRVGGKATAGEGLLTTRTLHGHAAIVDRDEWGLSSISCKVRKDGTHKVVRPRETRNQTLRPDDDVNPCLA